MLHKSVRCINHFIASRAPAHDDAFTALRDTRRIVYKVLKRVAAYFALAALRIDDIADLGIIRREERDADYRTDRAGIQVIQVRTITLWL